MTLSRTFLLLLLLSVLVVSCEDKEEDECASGRHIEEQSYDVPDSLYQVFFKDENDKFTFDVRLPNDTIKQLVFWSKEKVSTTSILEIDDWTTRCGTRFIQTLEEIQMEFNNRSNNGVIIFSLQNWGGSYSFGANVNCEIFEQDNCNGMEKKFISYLSNGQLHQDSVEIEGVKYNNVSVLIDSDSQYSLEKRDSLVVNSAGLVAFKMIADIGDYWYHIEK